MNSSPDSRRAARTWARALANSPPAGVQHGHGLAQGHRVQVLVVPQLQAGLGQGGRLLPAAQVVQGGRRRSRPGTPRKVRARPAALATSIPSMATATASSRRPRSSNKVRQVDAGPHPRPWPRPARPRRAATPRGGPGPPRGRSGGPWLCPGCSGHGPRPPGTRPPWPPRSPPGRWRWTRRTGPAASAPGRGRPGPGPGPRSGPRDQADHLLVGLEGARPVGDPQVEGQALGELAGHQRVGGRVDLGQGAPDQSHRPVGGASVGGRLPPPGPAARPCPSRPLPRAGRRAPTAQGPARTGAGPRRRRRARSAARPASTAAGRARSRLWAAYQCQGQLGGQPRVIAPVRGRQDGRQPAVQAGPLPGSSSA